MITKLKFFLLIIFLLSFVILVFAEENPLFPVVENGKRGYIDKTGKIIIKPQFEEVSPFSEGLACVESGGKMFY